MTDGNAEALAEQFITAAVAFVRDKYGELASAKIEREPDIAKRLAGARIATMKGDVRDLEDEVDAALRARLERDHVWRHQRSSGVVAQDTSALDRTTLDRAALDGALRFELGKLSNVLSRYGFIDRIAGGWGQWDSTGGYKSHKGEMMFAGTLAWTDEMEDLLRRYDELCSTL